MIQSSTPSSCLHHQIRTRSQRRDRHIGISLALATLTGIALLTGCASAAAPASGGNTTLSVATAIPPASFDPVQSDNSTVDFVGLTAYDTLIQFSNSGQIVPDLATSWTTSANGETITFNLHSGVTFHNGAPLTANDVQFTLNRIKTLNIGVASYIAPYTSSTVISPTKIAVHLSVPYTPFVANLSRVYILNSKLVEQHLGKDDGQSWLATHDAGSGPYELQSYTPNQQSVFIQYKKYWRGFNGQAKTVIYKYLTAGAQQRQGLLDGDVDLAMDINPTDWATFEHTKGFHVSKNATNVENYFMLKMEDAPTSNIYLREAIAYAFQYSQDLNDLLKGAGHPVKGVMPSGMMCSDPNVTQPTYDVAKAKQLLAMSGLKNVTLTLAYENSTAEADEAGPLMQADLQAIGITVKLQLVTFPEYDSMEGKVATTPDIGEIYAFPQNSDPDAILYDQFDSKFINVGENWGDYSNPAVNSLVEKAQQLPNGQARCNLYDQAETDIANDYAAVDVSNPDFVVVYNSRVHGYVYEPAHHQTTDVYKITVS